MGAIRFGMIGRGRSDWDEISHPKTDQTGWMNWLLSLLGRTTSRQHTATDFEVVPVHFIDNAPIIRTSIISYTFRYQQQLDPQQLHSSLSTLLNIGEWKKLRGFLRKNKQGQLEIHVPKSGPLSRRAIRFEHQDFGCNIEQHPLASHLPKGTGEHPSIQGGSLEFKAFSVPPNLPLDIKHYLSSYEPLLCLFVTTFRDATLVSITFPHAVSDAAGTAGMLEAWSHIMCKETNLIPAVVGNYEDVTAMIGIEADKRSAPEFVLEKYLLQGFTLIAFAIRYIWDLLTCRNTQSKSIFLSQSFVATLRSIIEAELHAECLDDSKQFPLSDSDIILAFLSCAVISSRSTSRPTTIMNVFDMRTRIDNTFDAKGVYQQNLILGLSTMVPPLSTDDLKLSDIAKNIRQSILTQATDSQARRLLGIFKSTNTLPLFGTSSSMVIACTNWSKAGLRQKANFGTASADEQDMNQSGKAFLPYWGTTLSITDKPRDTFIFYGRGDDGGFWIHGYLRPVTVQLLEECFALYCKTGAIDPSMLGLLI